MDRNIFQCDTVIENYNIDFADKIGVANKRDNICF